MYFYSVTLVLLFVARLLGITISPTSAENGGAIFDHGSGGIVLLRAA
jgi:hypothetical protein